MSVGTIFYGKLPLSTLSLCDNQQNTQTDLTYTESSGLNISKTTNITGDLVVSGTISSGGTDISGVDLAGVAYLANTQGFTGINTFSDIAYFTSSISNSGTNELNIDNGAVIKGNALIQGDLTVDGNLLADISGVAMLGSTNTFSATNTFDNVVITGNISNSSSDVNIDGNLIVSGTITSSDGSGINLTGVAYQAQENTFTENNTFQMPIYVSNYNNVVVSGSQNSLIATNGSGPSWNTVVGGNCMADKTGGQFCTAIGNGAGYNDISGQGNTYLGAVTGSDVSTNQFNYSTFIGYNCVPVSTAQDYQMVIGNTNNNVYIPGTLNTNQFNMSNSAGYGVLEYSSPGTLVFSVNPCTAGFITATNGTNICIWQYWNSSTMTYINLVQYSNLPSYNPTLSVPSQTANSNNQSNNPNMQIQYYNSSSATNVITCTGSIISVVA